MEKGTKYERYLKDIVIHDLEVSHKSVLLYGPRQVGKTTFVKSFVREGKDVYFSCDDSSVARSFVPVVRTLENLVRPYERVVIDEAQRITDAGLVLKILIDTFPEKRFIITGSSALELAYGVFDALTGRVRIHSMYPIAIAEMSHADRLSIGFSPSEILRFGSYPATLTAPGSTDKQETIATIADQYLFKDTLSFEMQKHPEFLEKLLALLGSQTGSLVSVNSLAKTLGVGRATIDRYLYLAAQLFIIYPLHPYHANFKKRLTRQSKYFFWDVGIRNALTKNFGDIEIRSDKGSLWENFVIMERIKYNASRKYLCNYYFYRGDNGAEIDLVEEEGGVAHCFEIKYDAKNVSRGARNAAAMINDDPNDFQVINRHNVLEFIAP